MAESRRKTTSRRELARNPRFEQVSPDVGELDEAAIDAAMRDDPDETMALIADLTAATDPKLRELARRLAGRLFLDVGRRGAVRPRGVGKIVERKYRPDGGDLDLDASLDGLVDAGGRGRAIDPERLRIRGWAKPGTALCLLLDRSASMGGKPLASSAVAAAAVSYWAPHDYSVVAFGSDIVVTKSQDADKSSDRVVNDVLALRGFGTTDLAGALRVASDQLARSRAGRKIVVVLSDCRATVEGDPVAVAAELQEVVVIAPEGESAAAEEFARRTGARMATAAGPAAVVDALATLLD